MSHVMGLAWAESASGWLVYCGCGWVGAPFMADALEAAEVWRSHRHAAVVASSESVGVVSDHWWTE